MDLISPAEMLNEMICEDCEAAESYGELVAKLHRMAYHGSAAEKCKAIRTVFNVSGRNKKQIVADVEGTWLAAWLI